MRKVKKTWGEVPAEVLVGQTMVFFCALGHAEVEDGEFDVLMQIPGYEAIEGDSALEPISNEAPTVSSEKLPNVPGEVTGSAEDASEDTKGIEEDGSGQFDEVYEDVPPADEEESSEEEIKPAKRTVKRPTIKR